MTSPLVLVTGATGQVGRTCVKALKAAGFRPVAATHADGSKIDLTRPFEEGLAQLRSSAGEVPAIIVHLAAAIPHDRRYPDDTNSATLTLDMDRHVYAAANAWGSHVVYMSTCAVYDPLDPSPKTPASRSKTGRSHYADAKQAGEALFANIGATILRLSAPTGRGSRTNVVFGRFAERGRAGLPIELWGSGRREQDFIDVDDVSDLIVAASRARMEGTFNCASGRPVTMASLAEEVVRHYRQGAVVYSGRDDPLESETARYDIGQTENAFGWSPRRDLKNMLESFDEAHADGRS